MLTRFRAMSDQDVMEFSLYETNLGYIVQDISGLDPVDAEISTSSYAGMDDEEIDSTRNTKRTITLRLGLDARYGSASVREMRSKLMRVFGPKKEVTFTFFDSDDAVKPLNIVGTVEKFSAPLFAQTPVANISIVCVKSNFYGNEPVVVEGVSYVDYMSELTPIEIHYEGDTPTGFVLELTASSGGFDTIAVTSEYPNGSIVSFNATNNQVAESAIVNTVVGSKGFWVYNSGYEYSLLYNVQPLVTWMMLYPGINKIYVIAGKTAPQSYTIRYTTKYGGL